MLKYLKSIPMKLPIIRIGIETCFTVTKLSGIAIYESDSTPLKSK